jgi:hypothetical protein
VSNFLDNEFGFSSLGGGGGASEGDVTGVGFADEVAFFFGETELEGNNFLFFRPTLVRLSIGDSSVATQTLDVTGTTKAESFTIVSGGTLTTPGAGNINISSNLGIGVTVGANPTQTLDVVGSITTTTDLDIHIDGFSTVLNEIYSIGRINFPETNSLTINSRSAIIFGEGNATLGGSQTMLLYDTGNLVIQNGGVFSDTGERLKVVGNVLVSGSNLVTTNSNSILRGTGATAATQVLVLNNQGGLAYRVRNDGRLYFGSQTESPNNSPHLVPSAFNNPILLFRIVGGVYDYSYSGWVFSSDTPMTQNSGGNQVGVSIAINFSPTSGSAVYNVLQINNSINNATITPPKAVKVSPTLTSATEFRGLDINVNTGAGTRQQFNFQGTAPILLGDGCNLEFGTTTGTKFGILATNRIGVWNATAINQPNTSVVGATYVAVGGGDIQTNDTFDAFTFAQFVRALRTIGLLA